MVHHLSYGSLVQNAVTHARQSPKRHLTARCAHQRKPARQRRCYWTCQSHYTGTGNSAERRRQALLDNVDDEAVSSSPLKTAWPDSSTGWPPGPRTEAMRDTYTQQGAGAASPGNQSATTADGWGSALNSPTYDRAYARPSPGSDTFQQADQYYAPSQPQQTPAKQPAAGQRASGGANPGYRLSQQMGADGGWADDWAGPAVDSDGWGPGEYSSDAWAATGVPQGPRTSAAGPSRTADGTQDQQYRKRDAAGQGLGQGGVGAFARGVFEAFTGTMSSDRRRDGPGLVADVVRLSKEEEELVLPLFPDVEQARYFAGDILSLAQRAGLAMMAVVITAAKAPLLAAGAFTSPMWLPYGQAALKNFQVRGKFDYIGLWRTKVLDIRLRQTQPLPASPLPRGGGLKGGTSAAVLETVVVVGDESGARAEMAVAYTPRHDVIQIGEAAELLVLSTDAEFKRFKALKEAYLPESGMWLSRYPFISKDHFLELSLEIERERQEASATNQPY